MDPNVRPQALVETFDEANSDSIRKYMSWALITLLTFPVSICTAECSFNGLPLLNQSLSQDLSEVERWAREMAFPGRP